MSDDRPTPSPEDRRTLAYVTGYRAGFAGRHWRGHLCDRAWMRGWRAGNERRTAGEERA